MGSRSRKKSNRPALPTQPPLSVRKQSLELLQQYQGPIPPASELEHYGRIDAGLPNRIMAMAESEQGHRHECDQQQLAIFEADLKRARDERRLGQVFGLVIGLVAIAAGVITVLGGHPIAGGFIGCAGVTGLVSVFVLGRVVPGDDASSKK